MVEAILLHIETRFCVRCAVKYNDLSRKYMSEVCCSITAQLEVKAEKMHPHPSAQWKKDCSIQQLTGMEWGLCSYIHIDDRCPMTQRDYFSDLQ